jgi:hypothetical protein
MRNSINNFGTTINSVTLSSFLCCNYQLPNISQISLCYFSSMILSEPVSSWRQAPRDPRPVFIFPTEHLRLSSARNILSDEMGLSFTIAAGPRQRSHSQVLVPRGSWPHFTVSDSRLLQPGTPGPRIYIPLEHSGPVIPPRGLGSLFVASYDS